MLYKNDSKCDAEPQLQNCIKDKDYTFLTLTFNITI